MAVVQNTLIGRTRGSIGGVTFSTQFGLNVAKGKPVSVANPNTDKQIMRRSALTQVTAIGRALLGVVSVTFRSLAVGKSAYNAFSSLALREAFDYSLPPVATFDPSMLMISKGTISPTAPISASVNAGTGVLTVTYPSANEGVGQHNSDLAVVVAHNPAAGKWLGAITTDIRNDGSAALDCSSILDSGAIVDVYLAFVGDGFVGASDSVHTTVGMS